MGQNYSLCGTSRAGYAMCGDKSTMAHCSTRGAVEPMQRRASELRTGNDIASRATVAQIVKSASRNVIRETGAVYSPRVCAAFDTCAHLYVIGGVAAG